MVERRGAQAILLLPDLALDLPLTNPAAPGDTLQVSLNVTSYPDLTVRAALL